MKTLSEKHGCQIINVIPEGYTSPIYDSMSLKEFKSMLEGDDSV